MAFISNSANVSLAEGVYNNVHGNLIYNNFYGKKRNRNAIEDGADYSVVAPSRVRKRRRLEEEEEIKIIRSKHLKLIREIGSGPGYLLHAAALSSGLLHPNVLRIKGISSPASQIHFIAYENVYWKNAEGPLAAALKDDLERSITLGFKMIAGISAGLNHLCVQGLSLGSMGVENFDIFLDVDDRFLISINPCLPREGDIAHFQEQDDKTWDVFNALCKKILVSANRVLHNEEIIRDPATLDLLPLDLLRPSAISEDATAAVLSSFGSAPSQNTREGKPAVPPRREYVWRTLNRGQQSLATVARRITLDLDTNLSPVHRLSRKDGRSAHRCAGYVREEVTLATTTFDSVVVAHDTPTPLEIYTICHEIVGIEEVFRCICGDPTPGTLRHTIKCQGCKLWSHSDCVGKQKEFTCQLCRVQYQTYYAEERREPREERRISSFTCFPPPVWPGRGTSQMPAPFHPEDLVHPQHQQGMSAFPVSLADTVFANAPDVQQGDEFVASHPFLWESPVVPKKALFSAQRLFEFPALTTVMPYDLATSPALEELDNPDTSAEELEVITHAQLLYAGPAESPVVPKKALFSAQRLFEFPALTTPMPYDLAISPALEELDDPDTSAEELEVITHAQLLYAGPAGYFTQRIFFSEVF